MRRLSLKVKLTLLYTILMMAVTGGVLALLFSLSGKELLASVQTQLKQRVFEAGEQIEYEKEKLNFDADLLSLEYGVYLSVYDADGYLLYGKVPYDFDNSALFDDGTVRKYTANGTDFYMMDLFYDIEEYGSVVIRGVTSITAAEASFRFAIRLAMILMPLLTILTAVSGYLMARRTLRPVSRITDTVRQIQEDGDLSRRVALGKGNDEIYRMAETFDRMLEQVEESFHREQQFASDASHELRTPVAAMMLQCEEILRDTQNANLDGETREGELDDKTCEKNLDEEKHKENWDDTICKRKLDEETRKGDWDDTICERKLDDKTREGIEMLSRKASYLSQVISQLLFLTRADQGRQKIAMERLNFSELAEIACEEAQGVAREKYREQIMDAEQALQDELSREPLIDVGEEGNMAARHVSERNTAEIAIETQIEPELYIRGDETLLIRFWMNLLQNAIAYGKAGGHIWVTLRRQGEWLQGSIRDDGIGIGEADLPRIWERFYQADASRTREDSSGLGLSMVKWIVKEHGGEITVRSELGKGTEFSFRLPAEE